MDVRAGVVVPKAPTVVQVSPVFSNEFAECSPIPVDGRCCDKG